MKCSSDEEFYPSQHPVENELKNSLTRDGPFPNGDLMPWTSKRRFVISSYSIVDMIVSLPRFPSRGCLFSVGSLGGGKADSLGEF